MFFGRKKKKPDKAASEPEAMEPNSGPTLASAPAGAPALDQASTQFITGDRSRDQRTIQVLLEAIRRVSESRGDLENQLRVIVDGSIEVTGAERGLLLIRDSKGELIVRLARSSAGVDILDDLRFSTTIAGRVLEDLKPVKATVNSDAEAMDLGQSVFDLKLRAVMCVPLTPGNREANAAAVANAQQASGQTANTAPAMGVLYVDSRAATRQFTRGDLSVFASLAMQCSVAIRNEELHHDSIEKVRLEQQEEQASIIQRNLMPSIPSDVAGYQLHGWYGPAERTSGDFYDFLKSRKGETAVVVGDVTGHGVGPALITASAQAGLRAYMRLTEDPGEVVSLLNQDLCERIEDGRFLTMFLGVLGADGHVVTLNAGHCPPLVWRAATGKIEELKSGSGPALGMLEDYSYEGSAELELQSGDVMLAFSDGILEARDPLNPENMFGQKGLEDCLSRLAPTGASPRDITMTLVEEAMRLTGGIREDDITVVVVKRV